MLDAIMEANIGLHPLLSSEQKSPIERVYHLS